MFELIRKKIGMEKRKYELIPNEGIRVVESGEVIRLGMTEGEIPVEREDMKVEGITIFRLPNGDEISEKSIWIYDITLCLTFRDNALSLMEATHYAGLYYNDIHLTDKNIKNTFFLLSKKGYSVRKSDDDTYFFDDLNLMFYIPSGDLHTIGLYVNDYYEINTTLKKYKSTIKKENGVTIIEYHDK